MEKPHGNALGNERNANVAIWCCFHMFTGKLLIHGTIEQIIFPLSKCPATLIGHGHYRHILGMRGYHPLYQLSFIVVQIECTGIMREKYFKILINNGECLLRGPA